MTKSTKRTLSEPARKCHDCGITGKARERWMNSDTCDACAYRASVAKWRDDLPLPPHGPGPNYPSAKCGCVYCRRAMAPLAGGHRL